MTIHPTFPFERDDMIELGQVAYEAYCVAAGGKSLATGAPLPQWGVLSEAIRVAWRAAADAVVMFQQLKREGGPHDRETAESGSSAARKDERLSVTLEFFNVAVKELVRQYGNRDVSRIEVIREALAIAEWEYIASPGIQESTTHDREASNAPAGGHDDTRPTSTGVSGPAPAEAATDE